MIAAATVIIICAHISVGFHHIRTMIANARIPLQLQSCSEEHIGAVFFATFFAVFFFAIICSFYLVSFKRHDPTGPGLICLICLIFLECCLFG